MSDDLVKWLRGWDHCWPSPGLERAVAKAADRIVTLTAERDAAYAKGYSDAETEISKSALGQRNDFLRSQYDNAKLRIEALTVDRAEARAGWHKYEGAWMAAEGKLADVEAERDRLRKALEDIIADCEADYPPSHGAIKYAARAALKGETP